ncbi:MAG: hypothetical protein JXM71_01415 [Spirochaetales bacterium]|nr:hypothetical protein [Spirochaetales bacterium]
MQKKHLAIAVLALAAATANAADLSIPYLGLLTNGQLNESGTFELSTRVSIDMLIAGGSKFDAWFSLGFRNAAVEDYLRAVGASSSLPADADLVDLTTAVANLEAGTGLSLRTMGIQVKEAFGSPLDLAAFVGHLDTFCSGEEFVSTFGTGDFATKFRGYMYYPDGIGDDPSRRYDGLHEVYGTGLRLTLPGDTLVPSLYAYQDSWLGAGRWSADARVMLNGELVRLEAFAGGSYPVSTLGVYRAGLLFHYDTGVIGDFYAQIGVPRWDPTEPFGMDALYFMFEPRVRFGDGTLTLSLFFHPAWYLQAETGESGAVELRFDLGFGEVAEGSMRGGVETELAYDPNLAASALSLDTAPYLQLIKNGVRWDLRMALRAFPFPNPWYGMFMPTIGVSTSY